MSEEYNLICGDALTEMRKMRDESFDLIITSPPYNLRNSVSASMRHPLKSGKWQNSKLSEGYESYTDDMPYNEYCQWQRDCLHEMMRLIPETGAIFYNHKWRVQNGLMQDRHEIIDGFPVRQIIIWARSGGMNFNDGYFVPTYEVIYMIAKPKFKLVPHACSKGDIWQIPQERNSDHPAPFPVELPSRIIESTDAQHIFDPFTGSGSTGIAALKHDRKFTGTELSQEYYKMASERMNYFLKNKKHADKKTSQVIQQTLFSQQ